MGGKNGQEDAGGGKVEQRIGLRKRQWHEPWSIATESPSRAAATSTSAALARTTVVVTRVKGTILVTGTPPSSSTANKGSTSANPATSSKAVASPSSSSAAPTTTAAPSPSSSSTQESTSVVVSTSTSTAQSSSTMVSSSSSTPSATLASSSSIAALTLSSLPSSIQIATALTLGSSTPSSSSSSSSTGSAAGVAGTAGALKSGDGDSVPMSTGSKIGIAFGAIIAGMLLGLLILWAYKRFSRDRRTKDTIQYPAKTNRRSMLHDNRYDNFDDDPSWNELNQNTYRNDAGYADGYDDGDEGVLATTRQGAYNNGFGGVGMPGQQPQMAMAHPYAATTYAAYPVPPGSARTRDLTNSANYASYFDAEAYDSHPQQYAQYDDGGRDSPTDYYGQALNSANTDMMIAAQYGDGTFSEDGHGGHAMGQAIASPYMGGMAITSGERATAQRVPINLNGNGPQIPPFSPMDSPHLMGSGVYADDAGGQSPASKQLSRKSSQAHPRTATGDQQLRQEYRDVARVAQVEEPITPTTANLAFAGFGLPPSAESTRVAPPMRGTQLTPMPMPERYRHGQPLTTLEEVETPASRMIGLDAVESDPFSDVPVFIPAARSSAESLALPLPREGQTHVGHSTDVRSLNSQGSTMPQYVFTPSSMHFTMPPSSPGTSLPESPASYADPSEYRSPLAGPSYQSAVSLHVPSPDNALPDRRAISTPAAQWAPTSGERLAAAAGVKTGAGTNNGSRGAISDRPFSTATNVEDAYDGI